MGPRPQTEPCRERAPSTPKRVTIPYIWDLTCRGERVGGAVPASRPSSFSSD